MNGTPIDLWGVADTFVETMLPPEHHAGTVRLTFVTTRIEGVTRVPFVVSRMVMSADAYEAFRFAIWSDRPGERERPRVDCAGSC